MVRQLLLPGELRRQTIRIALIVVGLVAIFWILTDQPDGRTGNSPGWVLTQAQQEMFLVSFIAGVLVSLASLIVTADSFRMRHTRGLQWELLLLTSLPSAEIVAVKYVSAQIRIQRVTAVVVGFRLGMVIMPGVDWLLSGGWRDLSGDVLTSIPAIVALMMIVALYVLEPLWQAHLITALHLDQSAHHASIAIFILAGLGSIVGLWIQIALLAAVFFLFVGLFVSLTSSLTKSNFPLNIFLCFIALIAARVMNGFCENTSKLVLDDLSEYIDQTA